jgi:hypothetical protein
VRLDHITPKWFEVVCDKHLHGISAIDNFPRFRWSLCIEALATSFPGGNSEWAPPDPIPNSEVKLLSADGSVGLPHVRVGHCQGLIPKNPCITCRGFFFLPQGWGGLESTSCPSKPDVWLSRVSAVLRTPLGTLLQSEKILRNELTKFRGSVECRPLRC